MSEMISDAGSAGAEGNSAPVVITGEGEGKLSVADAARTLSRARKPQQEQPEQRAPEAPQPQESEAPRAEDAAPPDAEAPGETQVTEPENTPPIEPPRSWTKEAKERWQSLPRETQEYLAQREQERDREIRRSQNDAAEKLKGLTAKEQAVEQARQHYEAALPQLLATLQNQAAGEFSDVRTIQDVENLARNDWPRYLQWDLAQKKIAAVQQQTAEAQHRANQELSHKFTDFARREDDLFIEKAPEMADKAKAAALQQQAMSVLKDVGFAEDELARSWQGANGLSLRDHRVQLLIRDATLWRDAQAKAKAATTKPVPPVQRPGVAPVKGAAREAQISQLNTRLEKVSGVNALRAAAELVRAKRASR